MAAKRSVFYQAVGNRITQWDVDVEAATLTPRGSTTLPSNVQYAWPSPGGKFLYVSTSDAASGNSPNAGSVHRLCALRIAADGALSHHGEPAVLPQRPVHSSVDVSGRYALTCYNKKSQLTVHRINEDGTVGEEIAQPQTLDLGIFAHQIVALPSNRAVVMVTRGNRAEHGKPEDPGALKIYGFEDGRLSPSANLAVGGNGGLGYGPRHLDFHPSKPWAYVSVETQNKIHMHTLEEKGLSPEPLFEAGSAIGRYTLDQHQMAGGIHVHPKGHAVYMSNRASTTVPFNGQQVFEGGENNIAVFSIDPATGEPKRIQNADPQSFHIRTFSLDPTGRMMVAASIVDMKVRDGDDIRYVPAGLTVFKVADDGRLTFARKYDVNLGGKYQWWTGFVTIG